MEESLVLLVLAPFSDMVQVQESFFAWVCAKGAGEDGSELPDGWGEEWSDEIDMTLRQRGEASMDESERDQACCLPWTFRESTRKGARD